MYNVYSYKQNNRSYRGFGMGASAAVFPMPNKLDEIPNYVIPHLATLKATLDEDESQSLENKLENSNVPFANLKLALFDPVNPIRNNKEKWAELSKKHKGNETFDSLYAYMISMQITGIEDFENHFEEVKNKPAAGF